MLTGDQVGGNFAVEETEVWARWAVFQHVRAREVAPKRDMMNVGSSSRSLSARRIHEKGNDMSRKNNGAAAGAGAVYGLGFFGAVIYYIQTATSFFGGLIGLFKAFFWPGILVYELMKFLEM